MNDRPNVLLILTDQQRADTIGALGNPIIKTPNLDRLCAEGTAFTSAFTPSPVCVPARGSLLYGQYPSNTRCFRNATPMPDDGRSSFLDVLSSSGYKTHGIGKMHFTPDPQGLRGFHKRERQEEFVRDINQDEYMKFLHENGLATQCAPHGVRGEMYYVPQPASVPAAFHPTQWIGDRSVAFLKENQKKSDEPWMLFSSFIHPHPPFCPPSPWHDLYHAPLMPLPHVPPDSESFHTWVNTHQNRYKYRDKGWDQNFLRSMKAYYYACISFIDFQVGRMLKVLEDQGQLDNTIIIYTSDHGEYLGDYRCFGKRGMLNPAANVPLIIRQPNRFKANTQCNAPSNLVDIAPTILSACETPLTSHTLDGVDLCALANGTQDREEVFIQFEQKQKAIYAIITHEWKYFYSAADDKEFLMDRIRDPQENRNMAGLAVLKEKQKELKNRLIKHLQSNGETDGLENGTWKKMPRYQPPVAPDEGLSKRQQPWADHSIPGYN